MSIVNNVLGVATLVGADDNTTGTPRQEPRGRNSGRSAPCKHVLHYGVQKLVIHIFLSCDNDLMWF